MRWLECQFDRMVNPAVSTSLLRKAVEKYPDNPALQERLGNALVACQQARDAMGPYEVALRLAPDKFRAWHMLALLHSESGRPDAAVDLCRRAESQGLVAKIKFVQACALRKLHRLDEARAAVQSALQSGQIHFAALRAYLALLAREPDGAELLELCDTLPRSYQDTALLRAHRAIALSRMGRTEEALRLVDLDRHVIRVPFVPPAQFGGIDRFNRRLADDILVDRSPSKPDGIDVNYAPNYRLSEAFVALRAFIMAAMEDYLNEARNLGLDAIMRPPEEGSLWTGSLVLREDAHNGEHIHAEAYLTAVYHVLLPDSVFQASDDRGALALGCCETYTDGYKPCWGTRYVKPVAGSLVIFPAHVFHDVVPSRTNAPRISVPANLEPTAATTPS